MPDQRLKLAAEEVKAVLKRYDIAGSCALVSETHGEYFMDISPSWSCATITPVREQKQPRPAYDSGGDAYVRIKAYRKDYPDKETWRNAINSTVGMITMFSSTSLELLKNCKALLESLEKNEGMKVEGENRHE